MGAIDDASGVALPDPERDRSTSVADSGRDGIDRVPVPVLSAVQIVSVTLRPSGFWLVTDSAGVVYATKSGWLSSLADQYRKLGTTVRVHSGGGWYYRDLRDITPLDSLVTEGATS